MDARRQAILDARRKKEDQVRGDQLKYSSIPTLGPCQLNVSLGP